MKEPLELVAGLLADPRQPRSGEVRGRRGSHEIDVRFVDRGVGSTRDPYTEVLVVGAVRPDLYLNVVPQTHADTTDVERGLGTDVQLGDARFDDVFLVEAAPAEVMPHLFDQSLRGRMRALAPMGVRTRADAGGKNEPGLLVEKPTWLESADDIGAMIDIAVYIADRVPYAFEAANRERLGRAGYRGADPASVEAERAAEVEGVKSRELARQSERQRRSCMIVLAVMLAILIINVVIAWIQAS